MRKSRWLMLLVVYCIYLVLGGIVIRAIESNQYLRRAYSKWENIKHLQGVLLNTSSDSDGRLDLRVIERLSHVCDVDFTEVEDFDRETEDIWSFYNSFFFCFTVVTTIGYGNLSPTTMEGKVFCILFALIGIPLNGILIATLGGYFTDMIVKRHQRMKTKSKENKMSTWIDTLFYLIPGMAVFFVLPAWCFILLEGWYFYDSIYYSVVTLTTVGFGDLVAGMRGQGSNSYGMWVYKIALIVWILFGMGYFIMILSFITKAYNKTPVKKITAKMTKGIVKTKKKIKKGLFRARDIGDINKLVKAVHIFDLQVVPKHRIRLRRSKSCSDLDTKLRDVSELRRVNSTSKIHKVDKEATFKKDWKDYEQQCQLLIQLATAMMSDSSEDVSDESVTEAYMSDSMEEVASVDMILPPDPEPDETDGGATQSDKHLCIPTEADRKMSLVDLMIESLNSMDRSKPPAVKEDTVETPATIGGNNNLCFTVNELASPETSAYRRSLSIPRSCDNRIHRAGARSRSLKLEKANALV